MTMTNKRLNTDQFLYGVCYFPEHWDESMWDDDFRRMKEMKMNVVRMGEGAWNIWEPEEGVYSFELFDKAIALCEKHGLKVILGTPTYTPPAWLTGKYPEVLRETFDGVTMNHGSRRHYNYTSPVYLSLCGQIVAAMAEHYKNNETVIGWQIDNELNCHMDVSFAESDRKAFREWCRRRYGTLEGVNKAWGAAFWAQTYTDWEQVDLPRPTPTYHSPGHLLDFYRFTSDSAVAFAKLQYDILKQAAPQQFVTHNGLFGNIDNHELTQQALDFMSYDSYPAFAFMNTKLAPHFKDRMSGLRLGRVRGMSAKFLILEQQAGPGGQSGGVLSGPSDYLQLTPKPGQMRLWAWQSAAHGADGVLFFRWRTCPYGAETLWHGLNHYGNQHHRRLDEAEKLGSEFERLGAMLAGTECASDMALMYDYDNDSNCKIERYLGQSEWDQEEALYRALNEKHWTTDQISAHYLADPESLNRYRAVFYLNAQLLEELDADALRSYAEQGGTVVFGPRSGYKNRSNRCHMLPFPGVLRELAGVEIADFTMVDPAAGSRMKLSESGTEADAPVFNDIIRTAAPETRVMASYMDDYYAGEAAVTVVPVGKGRVVYCGAFLTPDSAAILLEELGYGDPLAAWAQLPKEVEVVARRSASADYSVILNYTSEPRVLRLNEATMELTEQRICEGEHIIGPYGVNIFERKRS